MRVWYINLCRECIWCYYFYFFYFIQQPTHNSRPSKGDWAFKKILSISIEPSSHPLKPSAIILRIPLLPFVHTITHTLLPFFRSQSSARANHHELWNPMGENHHGCIIFLFHSRKYIIFLCYSCFCWSYTAASVLLPSFRACSMTWWFSSMTWQSIFPLWKITVVHGFAKEEQDGGTTTTLKGA